MLDKLIKEYEKRFNTEIMLDTFLDLDEEEQIKILKQCLELNQRLSENKYFNNNYMERVY